MIDYIAQAGQQIELQLCRPLSGAVSDLAVPPGRRVQDLQLCRPLSGAVRSPAGPAHRSQRPFNCAAPFRERLSGWRRRKRIHGLVLQLCRPLSGAVIARAASRHPRACGASIVPPPFGGGYQRKGDPTGKQIGCFNCAAPFRGRLCRHSRPSRRPRPGFNCAAPFRGRLSPCWWARVTPSTCFNCAAPFRERLSASSGYRQRFGAGASIVPPPFGSGYPCYPAQGRRKLAASIVPPPFGGGYPCCWERRKAGTESFNCAAPFRERLAVCASARLPHRVLLQLCRPLSGAVSSAPAPGAAPSSTSFNCAAPFRERLVG